MAQRVTRYRLGASRPSVLRRKIKQIPVVQSPHKSKRKRTIPYPRDPMAPWNMDLLNQEANREVNDELQPQIDLARSTAREDVGALRGVSEAAAKLLQAGIPITQEVYSQAQREQQGLLGGLGGAVRDRIATDRDAAAQFAASQGTPAPAPSIDTGRLSDTLFEGGAVIPGSDLISQGASAASQRQTEAAASAMKGQADVRAREQQEEKELLQLAQQRPDLRNKILDALFQREIAKAGARVQQQAQDLYGRQFGEKVRHDVAGEKAANRRARISEQNFQLAVEKHQFAVQQAEIEGRTIDSAASKASGYLVDQNGDPILSKDGTRIPVHNAKGAGGAGLTPNQKRTNIRMAGEAANKLYTDSQPGPPAFPGGPPTQAKHKRTFSQAQSYLVSTYGINRSKARQLLVAAGWRPDGRRPIDKPRG